MALYQSPTNWNNINVSVPQNSADSSNTNGKEVFEQSFFVSREYFKIDSFIPDYNKSEYL